MTKEEAKSFLVDISYDLGNMAVEDLSEKDGKKMREAIKALEQQPCEEYNYKALWEQVKWERDVATEQLEQLGYSLGEKIRTSEDCISRKKVLDIITDWFACGNIADGKSTMRAQIKALPSVTPQPKSEDMGEVSDGYHTFNQLYHQRAILFATIVNQNKDRAWKSYKHEDGKYCFDKDGEWFIVGIDTPLGSYTYHYSKEYWDYFDCEELECGKPWDGHTEEDVTRLLSLPSVTPKTSWTPVSELPKEQIKIGEYVFSENVLGTEGYTIRRAYYNYTTKQWFDGNDEIEWTEITHWMPLPEEPPKAESEDEDEEVQDDGI